MAAIKVIVWPRHWTMRDCVMYPKYLFVYGDNLLRVGCAGQAVIRDCPNSVGLITKKAPSNKPIAFYSDEDLVSYQRVLSRDIHTMYSMMESGEYTHLVIPLDGWGTGLAKLDSRAPALFALINEHYLELKRIAAEDPTEVRNHKVAVVGSRTFTDGEFLRNRLREIDDIDILISGGCPTGADAFAKEYAQIADIVYEEYPANWKKHGLAAGPLRNQQIVMAANLLVAFWDGVSEGTKNAIELAAHYKVPTIVYRH